MKRPLTRYEYCLGTKCQRLLWLCTHGEEGGFFDRELSVVQDDAFLREYLETCEDVTFIEEKDLYMAMAKTADAEYHKITNLSRGAYIKGAVACRPDLIKKRKDGDWDLYIVKAHTHIRQSICHDASYQIFVLAAFGIKIAEVYYVHINPDYVEGVSKRSSKIMTERITKRSTSLVSTVEKRATRALKTMRSDTIPKLDIRSACFTPMECESKAKCFSELPPDNVFDVSGVDRNTKIELYGEGIVRLEDVMESPLINAQQCKRIEMYLNDEDSVVQKKELSEFMNNLWYPMCYLDFECIQLPNPVFEGTRPYEQFPFQFSLHVQSEKGAEPEYKGFISPPSVDPRREIAMRLARDIPDGACVIAYGAQLERKIVSDLANMYPDLKKKLKSVHDNIRDVCIPFEKKYYYAPGSLGANSLKAVLRALYPDDENLDYKNLEGVHNGKEAAISYAMITCGDKDKDVNTILSELESYCSLDTLALAKIIDKFNEALDE